MTTLARCGLLLAVLAALVACRAGHKNEWTQTWGNEGNDLAFGLAVDSEGGLYAGHEFSGELDQAGRQYQAKGRPDVLIDAFTVAGKPRWQAQLDTSRAANVRAIAVNGDLIYVTGYFIDNLQGKGAKPLHAPLGGADAWVAGFDREGGLHFLRRFGGKGADTGMALCPLDDGGVLVGGTMQLAARFGAKPDGSANVLFSNGGSDVFLMALDGQGVPRWARLVGGPGDDRITALARAPGGGCMALVNFQKQVKLSVGQEERTFTSQSGEDGLVLGVGADGSVGLAVQLGHDGPDYWDALSVTDDGSIWVAGLLMGDHEYRFGDATRSLGSVGSSDIALVGFGADGRFKRAKRYGNALADAVHGLAPLPGGGVVLAASGSGEVTLDGHGFSAPTTQAYAVAFDDQGTATDVLPVRSQNGITVPTAVAVPGPGRIALLGMFRGELMATDEHDRRQEASADADGARGIDVAGEDDEEGRTDVFLAVRPLSGAPSEAGNANR